MTTPEESIARRLFDLFQAREWDMAGGLLAENVVVEWPHTAEIIRGRENVIALNRNYPEPWAIEVRRVTACGDMEIVEADVAHPAGVATVASFCEIENGLIVRARELWSEVGAEEPPEWRSAWAERTPVPVGLPG